MLMMLMQRVEAGVSSCFFYLLEETRYHPVPLEILEERSITSCGMSCMNHPKCLVFAISGKMCVLSDEVGINEYDKTNQEEKKWTMYKKVNLISNSSKDHSRYNAFFTLAGQNNIIT